MNEDEIIKNVKEQIQWSDHNTYKMALQGLLDLYQKEKEKNKTLETLLQGNLYQMYLYYKELASRYQANSVSKDKIKEKIEEIENMYNKLPKNPKEHLHSRTEYKIVIGELQSLLEKKEENNGKQ